MKAYAEMTRDELTAELKALKETYKSYQKMDLNLDMSRGKPSVEQLDLSMGMMDVLSSESDLACEDGTDCRNYGVLTGVHEAKVLLGDMMETNPDNIIIYGNSSLNVMYDTVSRAMTHGIMGNTPWCKLDKVNQLRHVRFFGDIHGMIEHMKKHADILRPKFEMVENILEDELGELGIGEWTKPCGGYFLCFESLEGCAKAIVKRCKKCGVKMTPAGATWPYGKDPYDRDIRIAPSYPPVEDLKIATKLFALSVKIVSAEKFLAQMQEEQTA